MSNKLMFWKDPLKEEEKREQQLEIRKEQLIEEYGIEQAQLKSKWSPVYKLGKQKIYVEILDQERALIKPAKIVDEHWLEFKVYGKKRRALITWQPKIMQVPYAFLGFLPKKRFGLIFHVGALAECTHDPERASLDIPMISQAMKLGKAINSSDAYEQMMKAAKKKSPWVEMIPWFAAMITAWLAMYFMSQGGV